MESNSNSNPEPGHFLAGGGEMGERIRTFDWSSTALGPISSWSPSLKMMVRFLLANRFPHLLWWGPDFIQIYNDPYRPILGSKHPDPGLGRPVSQCWAEIWHVLRPLVETPFNGGPSTWMEDITLEVNRHGFVEETHFTIAYSPVPDDTVPTGIGGVIATVNEITEKVVGERRVTVLRDLGTRSTEMQTAEEACIAAAETLAKHSLDIPFALLYLIDANGESAHLAGAANLSIGTPPSPQTIDLTNSSGENEAWPLSETIQAEAIQTVGDLAERFGDAVPVGPWSDPPSRAVVVPIRSNIAHHLSGLMVAGISSRLRLDESYYSFLELAAGQIATAIANARAYEEEKRRAEALAEIDRAKTAFFSNVSHEFRTPLTLMLGPLEDAINGALDVTQKQGLEVVHRNGLRLLKLVNSLLDFSRIEAGRVQASYEPTDLATYTTELASTFRSAIERVGIQFTVDCPTLSEPIYVDHDMWEKIVLNLLSNAFKFTFEGSITVGLQQVGKQVELRVSDAGTGIPRQELPRLFERFHRIRGAQSRTHEGTGIGLALVRELTRLHGGSVGVESEVGKGTTFTVRIPTGTTHLPADRIGTAEARPPASNESLGFVEEAIHWIQGNGIQTSSLASETGGVTSGRASQPTPRILLADDNADMRDYVERILRSYWDVESVSDGASALEAARRQVPDLVLSDVMMPGLDGFELLRELRADGSTREIPVILLSARAGEESRVEGMESGADDYLIKPFSARELVARVGAHLQLARQRREAQEQIRKILDSVTDGFVSLDRDWRYVYINAPAERMGVRRSELLGKNLWESFPELIGTETEAQLRRAVDNRVPVEFEGEHNNRLYSNKAYPTADGGLTIYFKDVTERNRSEQALRESEERFSKAFNASPHLMTISTYEDGRYVAVNESVLRATGYKREEMVGHAADELGIFAEPEGRAKLVKSFNKQGSIRDLEINLQGKHGRMMTILLSAEIIALNGRKCILTTSSDITERKRAEERRGKDLRAMTRLREVGNLCASAGNDVETCFEEIISAAIDITGADKGVIQLFDSSTRSLSVASSRGFKKPFLKFFSSVCDGSSACGTAMLSSERVIVEDVTASEIFLAKPTLKILLDAGVRAVQSTPLISGSGNLLGIISTHFKRPHRLADREIRLLDLLARQAADYLERKRAEEVLRANEAQLQTLFDETPLGAYLVDDQFRIRAVNPTARPVFGSIPDLIGSDFDEVMHRLWHKDYADEIVQLFRNTLETGEPYFTPERIEERRDLGVTEYYEWQINRIPLSEGGYGAVCYFRDISAQVAARTEREKLLAAERIAREEADAASRAKDEFLATVSHELRSPLNAMLGWSRLLSSGKLPEETAARGLRAIEQNAKAQAQLIEDLLDVSRIISGKFRLSHEPIRLAPVIEAAVDSVRPAAESKGIKLLLTLDPDAGPVLGDAGRLQQVVWNLLSNAVKFTGKGGRVQVALLRVNSRIEIVVSDTGQGISPGFLPHVFNRFSQADGSNTRAHSGLGLGLAIVRHITELHGGTVTADSDGSGKGATFTVKLPLMVMHSKNGDEERVHPGVSRDVGLHLRQTLQGIRVLVVDDDADTLLLLSTVLTESGAYVKTASSAEEAFAEVQVWRPNLIVSDIGMPGENGYEFMMRVKAWGRQTGSWIPAVALTAYSRVEDRMKTLAAGFQMHLPKPVEPAELVAVIESLVGDHLLPRLESSSLRRKMPEDA
jgi:PAS domain S-box-containing protein